MAGAFSQISVSYSNISRHSNEPPDDCQNSSGVIGASTIISGHVYARFMSASATGLRQFDFRRVRDVGVANAQ
jgi:hypothetical protein